jgi:signal transduction histidine kinase
MSSDHWRAQFTRDASQRERFLAIACVVMATLCIGAAYLDPGFLGPHRTVTRGLFFAYGAYGVVYLITTRVQGGSRWRLGVHATGVAVVCLVTLSTGGAHSPLLILYLLTLLAAAEGWGMRGTLLTAGACAIFLVESSLAFTSLAVGGSLGGLMAVSASLIVASYLLGYLAEEERRRHANALIISGLIGNALPEIGLSASIEGLLHSVRDYFDADQVRLVLRKVAGEEAFVWEAKRPNANEERLVRFSKLSDAERRAYFAILPEKVWRSVQERRPRDLEGLRVVASRPRVGSHRASPTAMGRFGALNDFGRDRLDMRVVGERHTLFVDFSSLLAVSFAYQKKWFGRFLVYNSARGAFGKGDTRFLEDLVREVAPAIYYMYHLGRLRSRAQATERTRLAHELHDGLIQELVSLEMQTEVVRRHASGDPAHLLEEIGRLQELLRKGVLDLRERMQLLKPIEVDSSRLVKCLAETVDQFRREQPIAASFVADGDEVSLSPRVCSELVRILQEALVNIRKHSGARKALVRFGRENGTWKLVVEDDGCGFGFTGRLSLAELEAASLGPRVIRERIGSIGGELAIESVPGCGARLEISLLPVAYEQSA